MSTLSAYPIRVQGHLDPPLSRWLWLVKWLLARPHYVVHYPRGIFNLVLGLNRWTLRVAAYATLMTDVYPPFRLDMGGDEPAVLEVRDDDPA